MECDPSEGKPARPIAGTEHEHPRDNRYQTDERNPYDVILKRILCAKVAEVENQPACARRNQNEADDDHREWTFIHKLRWPGGFLKRLCPPRYTTPVRLNFHNLFWLLRQSIVASFDDGCFGIAKGAAYSALLSFFPVLSSAAAILVQTRADFVAGTLQNLLSQIVPPGTEDLVVQRFSAGERPLGLLIGAGLISLWAASSVIKSLIEGFQVAYRLPRDRGFLHQSGVAIAMVLLAVAPLLAASLLILFGVEVERIVLNLIKVDPVLHPLSWAWQWLSRIMRYLLAFATTIAVTATLYYFGPYRRQRWRFVWPGAVLATVLWLLATSGFAWYVRNIAGYNAMYGSVGAGIALLVWMYLISAIALIGCEFNAEYERSYE